MFYQIITIDYFEQSTFLSAEHVKKTQRKCKDTFLGMFYLAIAIKCFMRPTFLSSEYVKEMQRCIPGFVLPDNRYRLFQVNNILKPRISKKNAKIRLSITGEIVCATQAPTGAIKVLAVTTLRNAGRLT